MQAPRPVFLAALTAAVVVAAGSLIAPRVAQALPRARAVVPAAQEALRDSVPEAARSLGVAPSAPVPAAAAPAPARVPAAAAGAGFATQELAGFTVPDFAAMAAGPTGSARLAPQGRRSAARLRQLRDGSG